MSSINSRLWLQQNHNRLQILQSKSEPIKNSKWPQVTSCSSNWSSCLSWHRMTSRMVPAATSQLSEYLHKCCVDPEKQYKMVKRNTEDLVNELRKKDECAGKNRKCFCWAHTKIYSESAGVKFLCCDKSLCSCCETPNSENAHDIFYLYGCRIGGCSSALPELEFVGQLSMRMGQMREWVASGCCPVGTASTMLCHGESRFLFSIECRRAL